MSILALIGINILPLTGKTYLMNSNTISVLVQPTMKAVVILELGTTTIQSCTTERELQVHSHDANINNENNDVYIFRNFFRCKTICSNFQ